MDIATKYQSYLIRLWQEHTHEPWRGTALNIQSGETIHFVDIDKLFTFMSTQVQPDHLGVDIDERSSE